ncbi:MAG TPA: DUF2304 domain-containing protein [Firmicutes bacterium]|nr:DUF2304 domain-containing protein [Bacillota bacterium]
MHERVLSPELQVSLIIGALALYFFIIYIIRKSNVRIDDMIAWILVSLFLLVISIVPIIPTTLSIWLGFISASNFIFTAGILVLIIFVFTLSVKVSQQAEKLKDLTHKVAILEKEVTEPNRKH